MKPNLPEIEFANKDVQEVESSVITTYEALTSRKLAPGDPVRLFLQSVASIIAHQRLLIDNAAKQNLLAYAKGHFLDHIGARKETERLQATSAQTTMRFSLSTPQPQTLVIPAGTRVTPGGQIFFRTIEPVTIPQGANAIDSLAHCTVLGTVGNDWQPGQINKLVDPLPWVEKVENITKSSGGANIEDDESYRERIRQSPETYSCAGPEEAYKYWARTAHQSIIDVSPTSPAPGEVLVTILLENGELPTEDILKIVADACSNKRVRPQTDKVTVVGREAVNYDIELTYWISGENKNLINSIQGSVDKAVVDFITWQHSKLGRHIDPSELITRVKNAGAKRVDLILPGYTHISKNQVAIANTVAVNYGGLEDD